MLTKEIIIKDFERTGIMQYDWSKNLKSPLSYDLFLTIGVVGYRVASYSTKTKRVILICPEIHIPQSSVIEKFIEYVRKKVGGKSE